MAGNVILRLSAAVSMLALSASLGLGAAYAEDGHPPPIEMSTLPPGGNPAPLAKTRQREGCFATNQGGDGPTAPISQRYLNFQSTWKFTRGAGQTVAVIDTGVARHPRLPGLVAGGDYVSAGDGTEDCDVHGTIVAGLIAAQPIPDYPNGFSGVAPDARIITIRANSSQYQEEGARDQNGDQVKGYGPKKALAAGIRHAVDMGATVINISLVNCFPEPRSDEGIGAAVKYAADHDVVVVAAAGNLGDAKMGAKCTKGVNANLLDPQHPNRNPWENVTAFVLPARYSKYVLTVGSVNPETGSPSEFTIPGPWVGIAAPGEQIVSLDPRSAGLSSSSQNGIYQGTSFAAPYVAGIAALVRARFPQLNAYQVMARLEQTAHAPGGGWNPYVGYGIVDPIAAVTADLPGDLAPMDPNTPETAKAQTHQLPLPTPPPPPNNTPRNVALIGTATITGLLSIGILASWPIRRVLNPRPKTPANRTAITT